MVRWSCKAAAPSETRRGAWPLCRPVTEVRRHGGFAVPEASAAPDLNARYCRAMGGEAPPLSARSLSRGGELAFILRKEREGASAPLLETLLELRSGDGPQALRDASDRLVRHDAPWALDLAALAQKLIEAAGNQRDQRLFLSWSLNPEPLPFEDLAAREGLQRRHANKLVRRSESRVRLALTTAPAPLPWLVLPCVPVSGPWPESNRWPRSSTVSAPASPTVAQLVTWLAGPYLPLRQRPGWLSSTPAPVVARTVAYINEDGGVRRLADLQAQLADVGISAGNFRPWLQANGAMPVEDLAVSVKGPLADVVECILDAYGEARTPEQIRADVASGGRHVDAGAVIRALGDRRRFTLSERGEAGLASWGQARGRALKKAHGRPAMGQDAKPNRRRRTARARRRDQRGAALALGAGRR